MTHITQELAASHTPIDVLSPADGSIVGSAANLTAEEVAQAVAGLRAEQPSWETVGIRGRRTWMEWYRDWLLDHDDELVGLLQAETAKPSQEARLELAMALDLINYYCKHAEAFLADEHPRGHRVITKTKRLTITRRPYPVVGVITPWNVPLLVFLFDSAPALLAGAAVVVKPSELTPLATRRAIDGWREIGAPEVFVCTPGAGATGAAIVEEVHFVQFTGSTRTGITIGRRAAERLIPSSLELGGKDAMIVLADADLERASNAAVWTATPLGVPPVSALHRGKHRPKKSSSRGDPRSRILRSSSAATRDRSPARKPNQVAVSARIRRSGVSWWPSRTLR
jgi:acyl-CoA reductase-like NAD-dependent aldehyde dehydrogenase